MSTVEPPLRVPITEASKRGVSWLNETAAARRVLLTRFGRVDAIVESAERFDADVAKLRTAARVVVEAFADDALTRRPRFGLDEVCDRLGIEPRRVHERSQQMRT